MSCNRFVEFKDKPVPPREDIGKVLEDYLGEVAISVEWKKDRFFAHLRGRGSNPFQRIPGAYHALEEDERWLEIYLGGDNIDVITRRQDELTNNIANGFAKLVARFWQGRYEREGDD